jgi:hypothetical protein
VQHPRKQTRCDKHEETSELANQTSAALTIVFTINAATPKSIVAIATQWTGVAQTTPYLGIRWTAFS